MKRKAQIGFRGFIFLIMFLIIFVAMFPVLKFFILQTASGQSPLMVLIIKSMPFILLIFGGLYFLLGGEQ